MNTAHFKKLSIFFPMWNEEEYLERALSAGRELCDVLVADGEIETYELIIIDDASTDRTPQIADAAAAADPRVKVVHHPVSRKLGGSMKTGLPLQLVTLFCIPMPTFPLTCLKCVAQFV